MILPYTMIITHRSIHSIIKANNKKLPLQNENWTCCEFVRQFLHAGVASSYKRVYFKYQF